jgi:hypothetical protein
VALYNTDNIIAGLVGEGNVGVPELLAAVLLDILA